MPNSGNGGMMPWMMFRQRPTTQETKQVSPTTEWLIPILQAVGIILAVWMGSSLTVAALTAWGGHDWEPFVTTGFGIALTVVMIHSINGLGEAEAKGQIGQRRAFGGILLLALVGLAGIAMLFYGLQALLSSADGLDVEIVRWWVILLGTVGSMAMGLGVLVAAGLQPSMLFMVLGSALAGLLYFLLPQLALRASWPWMLTLGAAGLDLGAALLIQAFKRELVNPYLPLPPHEEIMLKYIEGMFPEMGQEDTPWRQPIIMNGQEINRLTDNERERVDFERFVLAAWEDSTFEGLKKKWGYNRTAVARWRDWLVSQTLAKIDEPGRKNSTWQLLFPPSTIMDVFVWPSEEEE